MAEHRRIDAHGIVRIDGQLGDLLRIIQAQVLPGRAGIIGAIDAIANREIGPVQAFTASHIDDGRVRRCNGDGADGLRGLGIEDRLPGAAGISAGVALLGSSSAAMEINNALRTAFMGATPRAGEPAAGRRY